MAKEIFRLDEFTYPVDKLCVSTDLGPFMARMLNDFCEELAVNFCSDLSKCYFEGTPEYETDKDVMGISIYTAGSDEFHSDDPIGTWSLYDLILDEVENKVGGKVSRKDLLEKMAGKFDELAKKLRES